jgi:MFS family permease
MLMRAFGATRAELGALLGPLTLVFSVAGPLAGGVLVDRAMRRGDNLARLSIPVFAPLFVIPSSLAVLAPDANLAMLLVASTPAAVAATGTTMLALLQSMVPADMRGFAVALTGLVNTLVGAVCGPLFVSLLTDHVFGDLKLVGWSIAAVVVPSLLAASLLYAIARRAVHRQVAAGTAPPTLLQELALPTTGRGRTNP